MSNLETKLSYIAKHVLSIDEFNFEVRDLQVIISPKLKNERTEEDLVYFLQDAIYRKANEINNYYVGEGTRSLQLDFNGKDAIYVNFTTIPKIKKPLEFKDEMFNINEVYEKAIGELDLKALYDFNVKEAEKYIKEVLDKKLKNDNLEYGQKIANMM